MQSDVFADEDDRYLIKKSFVAIPKCKSPISLEQFLTTGTQNDSANVHLPKSHRGPSIQQTLSSLPLPLSNIQRLQTQSLHEEPQHSLIS